MAQIIKEIAVDVARRNLFQAIVAKQHDSNSRFLKVTLTNEGTAILVDINSVVTINACRADGEASAFSGTVNSDGTVTVPLTTWMLELDDLVKCDITVVDSESRKLTSTSFELEVETAAYDGSEIMEDENYDLLVSLLSNYAQLEQRIEDLEQNGTESGSTDSGGNVENGQNGGYYTPSVTQPDEGTVEFNFTPSREGMPEVPGQSVTLPAGPGGSGIHVGTEEPEDEGVDIWIDPDGEPVNLIEAPKAAAVGQTIVVSAVDENGAPIAWEAADLPAEVPSGTSEWKYAGKFTTTEHVNRFEITEDENGNPLSFKELFLRVNLHWFHHSDNFSANRDIDLLGGDGNWYGVSLNAVSALKLTKAATLDGITVLPTDVTPLRIDKIGNYVYASMALIDQYNSAINACCAAVGGKGTHCPGVTTFTGLRFSMGYATNLIVAGSNVEVYYK